MEAEQHLQSSLEVRGAGDGWRGQEIANLTDDCFLRRRLGARTRAAAPCITVWISLRTPATQAGMIRFWGSFLRYRIQCSHEKGPETAQKSVKCIGERTQERKVLLCSKWTKVRWWRLQQTGQRYKDLNSASRKGAASLPDTGRAQQQHQRVGKKPPCRFTESYPPYSSTGPTRLSCDLASSSGCALPTPATTLSPGPPAPAQLSPKPCL